MDSKIKGKTSTRVAGTITVNWVVDLPPGFEKEKGVICDDPAVNSVLDFLPQSGLVYLWGEDNPPVKVFIETHEEDVEIEDDDR